MDHENKFWKWFAGVIDGDGYVQVRNINGTNFNRLKSIGPKGLA